LKQHIHSNCVDSACSSLIVSQEASCGWSEVNASTNEWTLQGHLESLQREEQESALEELLPLLREHVCSTMDWSYLHQAHSVLLECRRVLSNAYVFQFFMFDPEHYQQVLSSPACDFCCSPGNESSKTVRTVHALKFYALDLRVERRKQLQQRCQANR
jgi:hypothetical protein